MTCHTDVAASFPGSRSRLDPAKAGFDAILQVFRTLIDRRKVRRMLDLDDHQLLDIGLEPSDIRSALDGPFHERASPRLQVLRAARSRARMARLLARRKKP